MFKEAKNDFETAKKYNNILSANLSTSLQSFLDNTKEKENLNINIYRNNFYYIFGVNFDASDNEIRKAYRRLMREYNINKKFENEEEKKYVEKMFRKIQNAYQILSDEEKRCLYDRNYYEIDERFFYDGYHYTNNTNHEDYMRNLLTMNKEIINDEIYKDNENKIVIKYKEYKEISFDKFNFFDFCLFSNRKIKLFGEKFIIKNNNKCYFILNDFKYKLSSIINNENLDIISEKGEFEIKLIGFDNITDISHIFENCKYLSPLNDFSKWNTTKITKMSHLFSGLKNEYLPDIYKWDTSNVTDMSYMFFGCENVKLLPDIYKWDTSNVTDMSYMFFGCENVKYLPDISNWKTSNVINMSNMFCFCTSLIVLPNISKWNTCKLENIEFMFRMCKSLSIIPDISKWNISRLQNINGIFNGCESLTFLPNISEWVKDTKKFSFKDINRGCFSLSYCPIFTHVLEEDVEWYENDYYRKYKYKDCLSGINYN